MKWEVGDVAEIVNIKSHPIVNGMECEIKSLLPRYQQNFDFEIFIPGFISSSEWRTWDIRNYNLRKLPPANTKTSWKNSIFKPKILETV